MGRHHRGARPGALRGARFLRRLGPALALGAALLAGGAVLRPGAAAGAGSPDLLKGEQLLAAGRRAEALALYRSLGERGAIPEARANAWLRAGRLLPDAREAESAYKRARDLAPGTEPSAVASYELGRLYYFLGDYRAADAALSAGQGRLAGTALAPDVVLFRARTAMALRYYREAAVAWRDLGRTRSRGQRALYGWGQALLDAGEAEEAMGLFQKSADSYPAGDFLAGSLAGAIRAADRAGQRDRAAAHRARLAVAAPSSFEARDLGITPALAGYWAGGRGERAGGARVKSPIESLGLRASPRMPAPQPSAEKTPAEGESYYVQLGLFGARENAEALLARIKKAGLAARLAAVGQGAAARYQVRTWAVYHSHDAAVQVAGHYQSAGFLTDIKRSEKP